MPIVSRIFAALCVLGMTTTAYAGEGAIHPSIAVSEEFNDNVFDTSTSRVSDYITHVLPGVTANYDAQAFKGDLNYTFDYRYYAKNSREHDRTHTIQANGHLTAVENLLFLDVNDQYQRVSLDVTRDLTNETLFANQSDRNVVSAAPYITLRPGQRTTVKTGYRYVDTRYFNLSGESAGFNKTNHVGYLEISHELSQRWTLKAGYTFTREESIAGNFNQHQGFGGFRYEYADKSFLFAEAGNTWTLFESGQRLNNIYWNAGLSHTFDTVTATASTGVSYDEDPLSNIIKNTVASGSVEKRLHNGSVRLSLAYNEYTLTSSDTLQTRKYSGTIGGTYEFTSHLAGNLAFTAEKYEQLLLHSYTRRLLVDSGLSYLLAEGLTLALNYNYVDLYSPGIATDNRHINRVTLEIRKVF